MNLRMPKAFYEAMSAEERDEYRREYRAAAYQRHKAEGKVAEWKATREAKLRAESAARKAKQTRRCKKCGAVGLLSEWPRCNPSERGERRLKSLCASCVAAFGESRRNALARLPKAEQSRERRRRRAVKAGRAFRPRGPAFPYAHVRAYREALRRRPADPLHDGHVRQYHYVRSYIGLNRRSVDALADFYVRKKILRMLPPELRKSAQITPELIAAKREQLLLDREIRRAHHAIETAANHPA